MWSNVENLHETYKISNLLNKYFLFKSKFNLHKTIKYKNRFLQKKTTALGKLSNFFAFKGNKIKYIKIFNYSNLLFLHKLNNVKTPYFFLYKYDYDDFLYNINENQLLSKIFSESDFFQDLNLFIPFFLNKNLPMVKPMLIVKKNLKKKKNLNKLKNKYTIKYIYVPYKHRISITMRWFSMLVKFTKKPLASYFLEMCLNLTETDDSCLVLKLKNQVYAGLAAEHE